MKCALILFAFTMTLGVMAAPQDARPPLSKDEVLDLLTSSTPTKVMLSTIQRYGIAFDPTPQILEDLRRAGADQSVLAAVRQAWHPEIPKPLGDKEIRMLLAADAPNENIARLVRERGIDFQPSAEFLGELRSKGAKDGLIDTLRTAVPRPFSKGDLLQQLSPGMDQDRVAQKVQQRGIDFEPSAANLQALREAGARAALLEAVRAARREKPFVAQMPAGPKLAPALVEGKTVALVCGPGESGVLIFSEANDLGKIATRLRCGEQVTFLERAVAPPGVDKIRYGGGKEGFVGNSYLETSLATPGGDVTAPSPIYKPDPAYTPEARHDRIEGTVQFWIVIDAQGNVSDIKEVSEPLGDGLDQSAIDTVKKWRFNPATRGGVPLAVRVRVEVSFRLGFRTR